MLSAITYRSKIGSIRIGVDSRADIRSGNTGERSVEIFLTEERLGKPGWHQLLMNILKEDSEDGKIIRKACESHTSKLIQIGLSHNISEVYQNPTLVTLQFRVVEIVYLLGSFSN